MTSEYEEELVNLCYRMLNAVCGKWERGERGMESRKSLKVYGIYLLAIAVICFLL
jgi:hypothetical protein